MHKLRWSFCFYPRANEGHAYSQQRHYHGSIRDVRFHAHDRGCGWHSLGHFNPSGYKILDPFDTRFVVSIPCLDGQEVPYNIYISNPNKQEESEWLMYRR